MANIKSAEKRILQNEKRRVRNRVVRGGSRSALKNAREAITAGSDDMAQAVRDAMKELDRAASKGIIHKNNAARRKSRLARMYNKAVAEA